MMFKKPKRNFRARRSQRSDSEDEGANGNTESSCGNDIVDMEVDPPEDFEPPSVVKKPKKKRDKEKKSKESKPSTALSFGEEEEGEVFKVKKSSSSRRIARQMKKQSLKEQAENERWEAEEKKRREEARKATPASPPLPKGFKKSRTPSPPRSNGSKSQGNNSPINERTPSPLVQEEDDYSSDEDSNKNRSFSAMFSGGAIPDAHMIHKARKQRQMARERGDFIPLEEQESRSSDKAGSRLIREEEHDLSEDEEERINFAVDGRETQLRKMQTTILAAQEEGQSDQEATEWEEQQIKKGVNMPQVQLIPEQMDTTYQQYMYTQSSNIFNPAGASYDPPASLVVPMATRTSKPLEEINIGALKKILQDRQNHPLQSTRISIPSYLSMPPSLTTPMPKRTTSMMSAFQYLQKFLPRDSLSLRLDSVDSVHRAHVNECSDIQSRLETCQETIEKCKTDKPELDRQSRFFQEMRGYIRDLVDCLNEKVPQIEYMERLMMTNLRQRADRLVARRQDDVKDQAADFTAAKIVPLGSQVPTTDADKQLRTAEREARRARRRRAREVQSLPDHNEGMSSDEEENSTENTRFTVERDRIIHDGRTIFEDVVDDFHNLDLIKRQFEEWKKRHNESYEEAYIGLCLPKLFTPFVKLRLIDWNPLQAPCKNFEEMGWFESLMFYGFLDSHDSPSQDADIKLLPSLIEKVLLPKITGLVESVYDPMSSTQTAGLVNVLKRLIVDYPSVNAESKQTQAVLKAVVKRLRKSLDDDVFMPLYPKQMLENKSSCQQAFHSRQFWSSVKLLSNILQWQGILSTPLLRELSLDCLLNRYILFALANSPINADTVCRLETIVYVLPAAWFSELEGQQTLPQLENMCRFITTATNTLQQTGELNKELNPAQARDLMRRMVPLLQRLHAMDHAMSMANQYRFKLA